MTMTEFGYRVITKTDSPTTVTSIVAYELQTTRSLRAVMWSVPDQNWVYAPAIAAALLFDPDHQEQGCPVDRRTADRVARQDLARDLPSEEALLTMLDEGEQNGWDWGPPAT